MVIQDETMANESICATWALVSDLNIVKISDGRTYYLGEEVQTFAVED